MRKIISLVLCTLYLVTFFTSCRRQSVQVVAVETEAIAVDSTADPLLDSAYLAHLAPVKAALEKDMSQVLGYTAERMWVGEPECPMLNWATDALWEAAKEVTASKIDIAVVNRGGMRCEWPAGPVTKGMVFELMPFDNKLVILTLKGSDVLALCESFARYGGQGVAGMRVKIVDGVLADVSIGGLPVRPDALYTVATSDYLSGGADHMDALARYSDYRDCDVLIRDLYIDAVRKQDTLRPQVDGRMTIL